MKARLICTTATAIGLGLATAPAATATPTASTAVNALVFSAAEVITGAPQGTVGNRHQLLLRYDGTRMSGWLRSWSCPADATVTTTWVSKRCSHRATQDLRPKFAHYPQTWISSTGRTGTFQTDQLVGVNRSTGYRRVMSTDLTFRAMSSRTYEGAPGDTYWTDSRASGDFAGAGVWVQKPADLAFGWSG